MVGSADVPERVAVTVASPPLSEIDDGDAASVTAGASSLSFTAAVTVPFARPAAP